MSSIESLKEQARRHEQNEEWIKALGLYEKAIAKLDAAEQPDIGLHNRVGDIQARLGNLDGAMEHYGRAIDLYMESELPNNAIAVCKKVLRNVPQRPAIHLRIGQIRASQGFLVDARASFLTYAEAMQKAGDIDAAFAALGEFADLAPDDAELRMMIAGQMEQHGHVDQAVEQLQAGYRNLMVRGDEQGAQAFASKIRDLDPQAELPDADALAAASAGAFETTSLSADDPLGGFGDIRLGGGEEKEEEAAGAEVGTSEGLDIRGADGEAAAVEEAPAGFETTGLEGGFGGSQPFGDIPGMDAPDGEEEAEPLPTFGDEDEEAAEPLPTFGDEDEDEEAAEPLPTFGLEDEEEEPAGAGELDAAAFGVREEREPGTLGGEMPELDAGLELGEAADAREGALEEAAGEARTADRDVMGHETLAERGDMEGAMKALRRLIDQDPDDVTHRQRMVEYAFRTGDEAVLVPAYLELAQTLEKAGQAIKARSVYQQVLSADPNNERAKAALGGASLPSSPVHEVASSEEYVDLGSMILDDDEDEEKSTRFVVAYEEPSGDEQADFTKMLSQFKAKVAETFSADDVRAHHDLGTAYKEMGLLDEAIGEFQQALRASPDHLPTYELLGQCFMEKGEPQAAARTLSRALDVPDLIEDDLLGIYYYLGRAHETLGNSNTALEFYDKVFALDINFADVTERLRALR